MNHSEHKATLHHGTACIDLLPRTRVNTGETDGGLLLTVGSEVQILSGTPESTAASLFSGFAAFYIFEKRAANLFRPAAHVPL